MSHSPSTAARARAARRIRRAAVGLSALLAGFGLAALTGLAIAKSFTLGVAKQGEVISMSSPKHVPIVVDAHGDAVYELSGDSARHQKCTKANGCFNFWFPVTVKSKKTKPTAAAGAKGKLTVLHRSGLFQVVLAGHPLYTFKFDTKKRVATGEGIRSFHGVWHAVLGSKEKGKTHTTTTTTTSTTTTAPYTYPVY